VGSDPILLRDVHVARNDCILYLLESDGTPVELPVWATGFLQEME